MISAGDFRNGVTIELEGNIYQIIEFQHVKPGKGAAFVRTKLKNIVSGGVVEKTFRPFTSSCLGSPQCTQPRTDCANDKKSNPLRTASWLCFYDSVSGFR